MSDPVHKEQRPTGSSDCDHPDFHADVKVNRFEDSGGFLCEVKVRCTACNLPFQFLSLALDRTASGRRDDERRRPRGTTGDCAIRPRVPSVVGRGWLWSERVGTTEPLSKENQLCGF